MPSFHILCVAAACSRHDILIEKRVIGRVLGKGGRDLEALQLCTGASVFIIDKYPPPGEGDDHRLVVLIGKPDQVRLCKQKVDTVLERAREELPPLPPPLTSGWRPVPSVGCVDIGSGGSSSMRGACSEIWMETGGTRKRSHDQVACGANPEDCQSTGTRPAPWLHSPGRSGGYADHISGEVGGGGSDSCSSVSRSKGVTGCGLSHADSDQLKHRGGDGCSHDYGQGGCDSYPHPYFFPYCDPVRLSPLPPGRSTCVEVGAGIIRPPGERVNAPPPRRVGNCFDWQRGICKRGENCKFSHGLYFEGNAPPMRQSCETHIS